MPKPLNLRPVDLRADGILWMINRSLFHPMGIALAWDQEQGTFYVSVLPDREIHFEEGVEVEKRRQWLALIASTRDENQTPGEASPNSALA